MSPLAILGSVLGGFLLGTIQGAFMPSLPQAVAALDLTLIFTVWLVTRFRFREALVAAGVAGISRGVLAALPAMLWAAAYLIAAGVAVALFTRIFTNRSWSGILGLTAVTYAVFHALLTTIRLAATVTEGAPTAAAWTDVTAASAAAALATQLGAAVIIFGLSAWFSRATRRNRY